MARNTSRELLRLQQATGKLSLRSIRLLESYGKLGNIKNNVLPTLGKHDVELNTRVDWENDKAIIFASFKLIVCYDDSPDADASGIPPIRVNATFALQYDFRKPVIRKYLNEAVHKVALLNVWPYWRELAQSLTVRMGLPPFPIPLISPASSIKFSDENEAKAQAK